MALTITYLDYSGMGCERTEEIYTRVGVERFVRLHGTTCIVDVKGKLPFLPQRNVAAAEDWLDRMNGVYEFDLNKIDELRMNEDE